MVLIDVAAGDERAVAGEEIHERAGGLPERPPLQRIAKDPRVADGDAPADVVGQPVLSLTHLETGRSPARRQDWRALAVHLPGGP
jgi:hypothetical protein